MNKKDIGHWIISDNINITEDTFGFIYEIINISTGKKYIGKKQCNRRIKRKPLKGKKQNRITYKESNWKKYTSSSKELNKDIIKYGKENFIFKILDTGMSKWELGYKEVKLQLDRDVILRDDYYNGIINVRIGPPPREFKALKSK